MKSSKSLRTLSITCSALSLVAIIYVDVEIATRYAHADGKTKALFGIVELLQFNYKYLILLPATLSIISAIAIVRLKEFKIWDAITILVALTAIVAVVTSSCRLML